MKPIRAYAVVDEKGIIVGYQNYDNEPNDILFRICATKKLAKQIKLQWEVIEVSIRPLKSKKRVR